MSTRITRNRLSSRPSSPAITVDTAQAGSSESGRNGDGPLDEWVEPPVRRLPPSYQDHRGLERLGVLELQQPLGEPPSQKLLARLKPPSNRYSNRATPLQNDEVVTPSVESEGPDFGSPAAVEAERLSEPSPQEPYHEEAVVISSPLRGRPAKRDAEEMRNPSYPSGFIPSPIEASFVAGPNTIAPPKPVSIQEHLRQDRVSNYIDRAIEEAERKGDLGLLPGLHKLKDKAFRKRDLWIVLEAIAHNSPDEEQLSIFKRHIKKGLKRHRRESGLSGSSVQPGFLGNNSQSPVHFGGASDDSLVVLSPAQPPHNTTTTFTSPFRPRPSPSQHTHTHSIHPPVHLSPSSKRGKMDGGNDRSSGKQASTESPHRRRSRSGSTSSSLSSAKSIPEEFGPDATEGEHEGEIADERPGVEHKRQGDKAKLRSSGISHQNSRHPFAAFPDVSKLVAKRLKKSREVYDEDSADFEANRKRFQEQSFQDYNYIPRSEVDDRHHVPYLDLEYPSTVATIKIPPPPVVHSQPVRVLDSKLESFASEVPSDKGLSNGTSRKRNYDEMADDDDDALSSVRSMSAEPPFAPPPPISAMRPSRAGTPRAAKIPAVNRARKSARVLVSPNKPKNGGITAGISRVGPAKESVIGNGAESGAEDNDEYCASCGGEGKLLCCDGCSNSMHHSCLEPPLDPEMEVDGEWFCPSCEAKRNKTVVQARGIVGKLVNRVQDIIPKAYALPFDVRDYFEGVRTSESGEYEEFGQPRTQTMPKMNRAGFIEEPNYKENRDQRGKLLTCYRCSKTASGRDLIPCDYCEHRWHLDCLDPPLAVPPRRRVGDKVNATWRCPLHVEQDLAGIGRQAEAAPGDLGRQPRPRKPKHARSHEPTLTRGHRNNGVIEVELSEDNLPNIKDIEMNGMVFRLPEEGIRLDFIDRVKKSWFEDESFARLAGRPPRMKQRQYRATGSPVSHKPDHVVFRMEEPDFFKGSQALAVVAGVEANKKLLKKSFFEQQAAMHLVELSKQMPGYSGDALADLTNSLIADAPEEAALLYQQNEKDALLKLQSLINRRLNIMDGVPLPPPPVERPAYPTPAPGKPVTKSRYPTLQPRPPPQPISQQEASQRPTPNPYQAGPLMNTNGYGNPTPMTNGASRPSPPVQQNSFSFAQNQQVHTASGQPPFLSQHSFQGQDQFPAQDRTGSHGSTPMQQQPQPRRDDSFDAMIDPQLFINGGAGMGGFGDEGLTVGIDVGDDEGNEGDVEMDGN